MKKEKDALREVIVHDTKQFLERGGQITQVPRGIGRDVVKLKRSTSQGRNKFIYEENTFNYDSAYHRKS